MEAVNRIEKVKFTDVFKKEVSNFTQWLISNIDFLSEVSGLHLEVEGYEVSIGKCRVDIICLDLETNSKVIIENQLGNSNHDHLGKIISYAAGIGFNNKISSVIWISEKFRDDHKRALSWLNEITINNLYFFGIEVSFFRSSYSEIVFPFFNVVIFPEEWRKNQINYEKGIEDEPINRKLISRYQYFLWNYAKHNYKRLTFGKLDPPLTGGAIIWKNIKRVPIVTSELVKKGEVRVSLYFSKLNKQKYLDLISLKEEIELKYDLRLIWRDTGTEALITKTLFGADLEDEEEWERLSRWQLENVLKIEEVFKSLM